MEDAAGKSLSVTVPAKPIKVLRIYLRLEKGIDKKEEEESTTQ
jgi:hypothetical protein